MHKVSIIVPVYNTEKYLERCIQSIINQSYHNIEIILVNDGSTDGSGLVCDSYSSLDSRIKVIHQCNKGVASARNSGIDISKGAYIMFIDSDDELYLDATTKLINTMSYSQADIVTGLVKCISIDAKYAKSLNKLVNQEPGITNNYEGIFKFISNTGGVSSCARLYKKSILNGVRFRDDVRINEDRLFVYEAMTRSDKSVWVDLAVYKYHLSDNSTMRSGISGKYFDIALVSARITESIKKMYPTLAGLASYSDLRVLLVLYNRIALSSTLRRQYDDDQNALRERIIKFEKSRLINNADRLKLFLLRKSPSLYTHLIFLYCKTKFVMGAKA